MGKAATCCRADPKRVRMAHEKNLLENKGIGKGAPSPRSSFKKPDTIIEPNFDRKYNTIDPPNVKTSKY